jgi:hypothetical protein
VACDECRALAAHAFRTVDDLVHAVRLAAEETDRGVLVRIETDPLSRAEREALDSSLASGALPGAIRYRFRCSVCGDTFSLTADTRTGEGAWARE